MTELQRKVRAQGDLSFTEIARRVGCARGTVYGILSPVHHCHCGRAISARNSQCGACRRAEDAERRLRVSRMWIAGASVEEIARVHGAATPKSMRVRIAQWRGQGHLDEFPHRYAGYDEAAA